MTETSYVSAPDLRVAHRGPGRAVHADAEGALYMSKHLSIFRSVDDGLTWQLVFSIPRAWQHWVIERSRLACRLFRHEVRALRLLSDGAAAAATRQGLFWAAPGQTRMQPAVIHDDGKPFAWPMTLSQLPGDCLIWGEYFGNSARRPVSLFVSDDSGRTYHRAFTFAAGQTRHVHNIYHDRSLNQHWVLTGDYGDDPGFALLSPDFEHVEWVVRGQQKYRAVCMHDFGDHLVYGTDTDREPNAIYRMDKATGRVDKLADVDGSCIYGCRCGDYYVFSTSAEPSSVNVDHVSTIWLSRDGDRWQRLVSRPKDMWSFKYFQFGSLILPRGDSGRNMLMFSGRALKEVDGLVYVVDLESQL